MWGAIADTVGGDNIAAAFIKDWGAINPEQFLAAKPDVVIISGTEAGLKQPAAMAMGIGIEAAEAQKRLQGFIRRAGWAEIPAVRNGRVFGIYHSASRSLSDLASAQFIAKALYPEAFADVNPEETYREFHRKYLPVEPKGTFFIRLGCDGLEDCNKQAAADTVAASAETVAEPSLWQRIKKLVCRPLCLKVVQNAPTGKRTYPTRRLCGRRQYRFDDWNKAKVYSVLGPELVRANPR